MNRISIKGPSTITLKINGVPVRVPCVVMVKDINLNDTMMYLNSFRTLKIKCEKIKENKPVVEEKKNKKKR